MDIVLDQKIADYGKKQLENGPKEDVANNNDEFRKPQIYIDQVLDMFNEVNSMD